MKHSNIPQVLLKKLEADQVYERYGIKYLGMFGSYARGEQTAESDVDLYVSFKPEQATTLFDLARLQNELEADTGLEYDLVTKINKHVAPYIQQDLMTIYEEN